MKYTIMYHAAHFLCSFVMLKVVSVNKCYCNELIGFLVVSHLWFRITCIFKVRHLRCRL